MLRTLCAFPLALLLTAAPIATTAAVAAVVADKPAAAPIALLQPGDQQLSCDALAEQINALALADTKPKKKKGFSLGGLGKVLMLATPVGAIAAPMMMGGNGMGGALLGQAASLAEDGAARAQVRQANDAAAAALAGAAPTIETQRKARLMTIFDAKKC